ncbi:MAG: hypothetical protein WBW48_05490 [Anaerolineae bacterium]
MDRAFDNHVVLVVFGDSLPRRVRREVSTIIAPASLAREVRASGLDFVDLDSLIDFGNIYEAAAFTERLTQIKLPDGRGLTKLVTLQGYDLWWIHYDALYYNFLLPLTQYRRLLDRLVEFSEVQFYGISNLSLFRYYLEAYGVRWVNLQRWGARILWWKCLLREIFDSLFSFLALMLLKGRGAKVLLHPCFGDLLDYPHDYDFRMRRVFEELRARNIPFVEIVRSTQPLRVMLQHARIRRRPVIYSSSLVMLIYRMGDALSGQGNLQRKVVQQMAVRSPEERFLARVAMHYQRNARNPVIAIRLMSTILRWLGIRVAFVLHPSARSLHELIACKLNNIPTVGIQHGAGKRFYIVSEYMAGYEGARSLGTDVFGCWSEYWYNEYRQYSRVLRPEQLQIAGHLRPVPAELLSTGEQQPHDSDVIRVLHVSDTIVDPREPLPYLRALVANPRLRVTIKARPMIKDRLVAYLRDHAPDVFAQIEVVTGDIHQAVARSDVVVGCYSTAILEGLLQLKPLVFFNTRRWGDYYEFKTIKIAHGFFAESPEVASECVRAVLQTPRETLEQLRDYFWGDPTRDGGKWVVDQIERLLQCELDARGGHCT